MVAEFSYVQRSLLYVPLACWHWATVNFSGIVRLVPGYFGSIHGVNISSVAYRLSLIIIPYLTCFPPTRLFLQGGGVCVERLDHNVKRFVVRLSTDCGEGLDDEIGYNIINRLWICDI